MAKEQLAGGIWASFGTTEDPFAVPNGMEENLRRIDDHMALSTLSGPILSTSALPANPAPGSGQVFTNGSYAVFNGGVWKRYPALVGLIAMEMATRTLYLNIGTAWLIVANKLERSYLTRAAMVADTTQPAGTQGIVTDDPAHTEASPINGYYTWTGAQWTRNAYQPAMRADVDRLMALARQFTVFQGNGRVVIDVERAVVRYPILAICRNGETSRILTPAAGASEFFELPMSLAVSGSKAVYHYIDMSQYGIAATHEELFKFTESGFMPPRSENIVPLGVCWWGQYQSFTGQEVLWMDRALNGDLDGFSPRFKLIYDRINALGGGRGVLYAPRQFFYRSFHARNASTVNVSNPESLELANYVKLPMTVSPDSIETAYIDLASGELKVAKYPTAPQATNGRYPFIALMSLWGDSIVSHAGCVIEDTGRITASNMFPYAMGDDPDYIPWKFGTAAQTSIVTLTNPDLISKGFKKGVGGTRPYIGGNLPFYAPGAMAFARVYVERPEGSTWVSAQVYIWNASTYIQAVTLRLVSTISPTLRVYEGAFLLSDDASSSRFLIGADAAAGQTATIAGFQFAVARSNCAYIARSDYPRMPSLAPNDGTSADATAVAMSAIRQQQPVVNLQRPTAKYNVKVLYGQSLGRGQETWPALSRTGRYGNLQLGGNVLPAASDGDTYPTFGSAALQPLIAQSADGSTLLSPQQEAALAPGAAAFGEPPNHAWLNFAKHLHNQAVLVSNDETRLFVTLNPSVSGRTIEQLSKVNSQDAVNRYARFVDGITKIKAAAAADTCVVDGICWMQGEYNYYSNGGSWDKATYKTLLAQLISDMQADAMATTGQSAKPAFLMYQTGAAYTRDIDSAGTPGLHVGMAQLETALERTDVAMVGPIYPYTDKGGHLDSNGSRWFGHMIGKVWDRVVRQGRRWLPLMPTKISGSGREILIEFHVPVPPLKFDLPYVVNAATDYAAKGFKVTDSSGTPGISSVQIVGAATIKITLARDLAADAFVWYADKTVHNGNGCLRDSDSTVALDNYVYEPERGMYASANIPALVGKPYPLQNWCVAFHRPLGWSFNG
ncbi:hypothetical protein CTR2_R19140 [Comamonas thiooxydans]|uniref:hypothetical protein n=1 Tax=Comamonas thiooxydans TaxID=363952 RepID=UPI000A2D8A16|nr:hypothetical protein [Comamonas thiooxydans]BDR08576.1 hypothetical protein CTR2_R19140 [Comamonas thiooxydans]